MSGSPEVWISAQGRHAGSNHLEALWIETAVPVHTSPDTHRRVTAGDRNLRQDHLAETLDLGTLHRVDSQEGTEWRPHQTAVLQQGSGGRGWGPDEGQGMPPRQVPLQSE